MPALVEQLPGLYRDLLPAFFEREVPAEVKATCANCAMCEGGARGLVDSVDGKSRLFSPSTKCCTYHPRLPNYLVGAVLCSEDPALAEGRRRLLAKVEARVGLTPQWLKAPARYTQLYDGARRAFGRAESLRCPYYDTRGGGCTVWAAREAVCSTYFCQHVAGADGRRFWMSLKQHLALVEHTLSRWAAFQLAPHWILDGLDRQEQSARALGPEDLDERPAEDQHRRLWRDWVGREAELYRQAYLRVRSLSRVDLERMLGLDGELSLAVLDRHHHAATQPALPATLQLSSEATIKWLPDGSVALGAYSEHEALALPGGAYTLLVRFDGRSPVSEVRQRLRDELGGDLSEPVLLALYQQRVLVEP